MLYENEELFGNMLPYPSWESMIMQVSSYGKKNKCISRSKMNFSHFLAQIHLFREVLSILKFNRYVNSTMKKVSSMERRQIAQGLELSAFEDTYCVKTHFLPDNSSFGQTSSVVIFCNFR